MSSAPDESANMSGKPKNKCQEIETESEQTSTSEILTKFLEETTLHGTKYVSHAYGNSLIRLFWAAAVATMTIILGLQIHNLIVTYYSYPIQTTTNTQVVSKLSFPAVTICNLSPYSKQNYTPDLWTWNLFLHSTPLNLFENKTLLNCSLSENEEFCNKSSLDAYNVIGQKLATTVHYCRWQKHHDCVPNFTERVTDLGMCFTFNHNGTFRSGATGSQNGLWLTLSVNTDYNIISEALSSGMKIVIHDPHEEPDVVGRGIVLAPGSANYVDIKPVKYTFLPEPYKAFGDSRCLDTHSATFVNPLQWHENYSHHACQRECYLNFVIRQCGCRTPNLPGNATVCTTRSILECVDNLPEIYEKSSAYQKACDCRSPCKLLMYESQVSTADFPSLDAAVVLTNVLGPYLGFANDTQKGFKYFRRNLAELRIYFGCLMVEEVQQVPQYDILKIFGMLGGQMGLFLGASLLSLGELGQLLFRLTLRVLQKPKPKPHNNVNKN